MPRFTVASEVESQQFPGTLFSAQAPGPGFIASEVETVFPVAKTLRLQRDGQDGQPPEGTGADDVPRLFVVVTFQHVVPSLIDYSADATEVKDTSRDVFVDFSEAFAHQLQAAAAAIGGPGAPVWSDAADPASGLAVSGECGPSTYSEVDAIEQLLAYDVQHVGTAGGGCRLITHPRFGVDIYPASCFAFCQRSVLLAALANM